MFDESPGQKPVIRSVNPDDCEVGNDRRAIPELQSTGSAEAAYVTQIGISAGKREAASKTHGELKSDGVAAHFSPDDVPKAEVCVVKDRGGKHLSIAIENVDDIFTGDRIKSEFIVVDELPRPVRSLDPHPRPPSRLPLHSHRPVKCLYPGANLSGRCVEFARDALL